MMIRESVSLLQLPGVCLTSFGRAQTQGATPQDRSSVTSPAPVRPEWSTRREAGSNHHAPAVAILNKRIDLGFSSLTLAQAVDVLSKSTGLRVALDPGVKSTVIVSLEVQNVPLYHVLEIIVHQPGTGMLMISPKAGGVLLEPYPTHEVNGKRELNMGTNPPWSAAWDLESNRAGLVGAASTRENVFVSRTPIQAAAQGEPTIPDRVKSEVPVAVPFGDPTVCSASAAGT